MLARFLSAAGLAALCMSVATAAQLPSARPRAHFPVPNDTVAALAEHAGTLYVGGNFDRVGLYTGPFAVLGTADSAPRWERAPGIRGEVLAIVADGLEGWFVAGTFDQVGEERRQGVVHLLADGSLAAWNPGVRGSVSALCLSGDTLYLGGQFDIGGGPQRNLAAVDASTGARLAWNPLANSGLGTSDSIRVLVRLGSAVLVGGYFPGANFAGAVRSHLVFVDALTGALYPDTPSCDGQVSAALAGPGGVLLAGNFGALGGVPRGRLAWIGADGTLGPVFPAPNSDVSALALVGTTLYLGGSFSAVDGQPRARLAALELLSLHLLPWAPEVAGFDGSGTLVDALAADGTRVFVAGAFQSAAGAERRSLAALDPVSGAALGYDARLSGIPGSTRVRALARTGSALAVGGNFLVAKSERRNGLAAFDLEHGTLLPWAPDVGVTKAIELDGEHLYVGGTFTHVNGVLRPRLARLERATGALVPGFDAGYCSNSGAVISLARAGKRLFVGGSCLSRCGENCRSVDGLDAASGQRLTGWEVSASNAVFDLALAPDGATLYLAGPFSTVGSPANGFQPRDGLAAVDVGSGAVLPWDPHAILGDGSAILGRPTSLLVAGTFQAIGGGPRHVAEVDLELGLPSPWDAHVAGSGSTGISALAQNDTHVFLAGAFDSVGGLGLSNLAAVDAVSGAPTAWNPGPREGVLALLWTKQGLVASGGRGYRLGVVPNLALFEAPARLVRLR